MPFYERNSGQKLHTQLPELDLVAIAQGKWLVRDETLTIDQRAIRAIEILDQHLTMLDEQARMAATNAMIERTVLR